MVPVIPVVATQHKQLLKTLDNSELPRPRSPFKLNEGYLID